MLLTEEDIKNRLRDKIGFEKIFTVYSSDSGAGKTQYIKNQCYE